MAALAMQSQSFFLTDDFRRTANTESAGMLTDGHPYWFGENPDSPAVA